MGLCGSNDVSAEEAARRRQEKDKSRALESQLTSEQNKENAINKLLLLGAGESGKSTLFKQMITIYGKGYPEAERKSFIPIIHNNALSSMKVLLTQCDKYGPPSDEIAESRRVIDECKGDEEIDENLGRHLGLLWSDPGIQTTYDNRSHYQLVDSTKYFLDKAEEISKPDYIPTEQDVLRSRVRTTGIVENDFVIDGNQFKMYDVGGQRNERKKWIHCFENVTAVLFVAAVSEYDQVLYEDENMNRVVESLNLFEEICNSRWFRDTAMVLFLNKRDLFSEKIQRVPLSTYFPDYKGSTYEEAAKFVQDLFITRNKNPEKAIYAHLTCATDTHNVAAVFNAVKDIIIRKSLNEAGLV